MMTPPILLPDASTFADVLEYSGEWSCEDAKNPRPRIIRNGPTSGNYYASGTVRTMRAGNEIGPYCTIDLRQIGGAAHRGIAVRATDDVIAALTPRIVTPDDTLSFKIIAHSDGRALVVCQHGYIIGSHWVAYIDPATIPPYPFADRDAAADRIRAALRDAGHTPFRRDLPEHGIEITSRTGAADLWARIAADGTVTRQWADGTISHA